MESMRMIPTTVPLDQQALAAELNADAIVQEYRAFFALLDWDQVSERATDRPWPGEQPHPEAAYIKALLVKLSEHKDYITHLRTFLLKHPLLVLELGFHPVLDASQRYGFDVERT